MIPAQAQRYLQDRVSPEPNTGCWLWLGVINSGGYAHARIGGRLFKAHRLAYVLHKGPIPDGLVIDHLCRVRCCVNPAHLEAVTGKVNTQRGMSPSTLAKRTGKCKRGHELVGKNRLPKSRGVTCRICFYARTNKVRAEARAARDRKVFVEARSTLGAGLKERGA